MTVGRKPSAESLESTRARASGIVAVLDRLDTIESWIRDGVGPRRLAAKAQRPPPDGLGLSRTTANRYVAATLLRLQRDGETEPIETKRARIVAMLEGQIQRALNKTRIDRHNGESVEYACPDLAAANTAILALAEIEGVRRTG